MNNMFIELKRQIDENRARIEYVEDVECPFEINCSEIWIEGNRLHAKTMSKKAYEHKQRRKEKIEMQKIKKEWEDR